MIGYLWDPVKQFGLMACLFLWIGVSGCSENQAPKPKAFVIKSGSVLISTAEFSQELELKLTAYPFDLKNDAEAYNAMVLDLVSSLSDELVFLAAAKDKGMVVSPLELEAAEARFRADFPEDSFEQMLLENAISYEVWKKRVLKDLVIQKLVNSELIQAQEITPDDVVAFYKKYEAMGKKTADMDEAGLVRQLRLEKSQMSYEKWMDGLTERYPVEINKKAVAAFFVDKK